MNKKDIENLALLYEGYDGASTYSDSIGRTKLSSNIKHGEEDYDQDLEDIRTLEKEMEDWKEWFDKYYDPDDIYSQEQHDLYNQKSFELDSMKNAFEKKYGISSDRNAVPKDEDYWYDEFDPNQIPPYDYNESDYDQFD